jgi:hypothetical protein
MVTLKALNSGIAFALELAMLAAFGYWGYWYGAEVWIKWVYALGIPALVIVIWGFFFAPKSNRRLPLLPGVIFSLGLVLLSAVALFYANQVYLALGIAVVAIANRALVFVWRQW